MVVPRPGRTHLATLGAALTGSQGRRADGWPRRRPRLGNRRLRGTEEEGKRGEIPWPLSSPEC